MRFQRRIQTHLLTYLLNHSLYHLMFQVSVMSSLRSGSGSRAARGWRRLLARRCSTWARPAALLRRTGGSGRPEFHGLEAEPPRDLGGCGGSRCHLRRLSWSNWSGTSPAATGVDGPRRSSVAALRPLQTANRSDDVTPRRLRYQQYRLVIILFTYLVI